MMNYSYFTDPRDGQKYNTIEIDGKIWMAQNMNIKMGDYDYLTSYGRLYQYWDALKFVPPPGWHLPDEEEWDLLIDLFGGYSSTEEYKKGIGTKTIGNLLKNGISHFNAELGGYADRDGRICCVGRFGQYWINRGEDVGYNTKMLYLTGAYVTKLDLALYIGCSVRCIMD